MTSIVTAFGLAITVTRPSPDDDAVQTSGIWLSPADEPQPFGTDFNRVGPRHVMAIPLSASLQTVPNGSQIVAAEYDGGPILRWRVDGSVDAKRPDEARVFLKQIA